MFDLDLKTKQQRPFLVPPEVQLQSEKEDKNKGTLFHHARQLYCNYIALQRRHYTTVDVTVPESVGTRQAHYARGHWTIQTQLLYEVVVYYFSYLYCP